MREGTREEKREGKGVREENEEEGLRGDEERMGEEKKII